MLLPSLPETHLHPHRLVRARELQPFSLCAEAVLGRHRECGWGKAGGGAQVRLENWARAPGKVPSAEQAERGTVLEAIGHGKASAGGTEQSGEEGGIFSINTLHFHFHFSEKLRFSYIQAHTALIFTVI